VLDHGVRVLTGLEGLKQQLEGGQGGLSQVSFNYPHNRLILRENRVCDAGHMAKWFNDRENSKWMDDSSSSYSERELEDQILRPNSWALDMTMMLGDKDPIGYCSIYNIDPKMRSGEISFLIGEARHKGQGLAKELVEGLTKLWFEELGLDMLYCSVLSENAPCLHVLMTYGFALVKSTPKKDIEPNEVYLELTREDHFKAKKG